MASMEPAAARGAKPEPLPANYIQVNGEKLPMTYVRVGKILLAGNADKPAHNQIVLTALGIATKTAIAAAAILERQECVQIVKVETTSFHSLQIRPRVLPKISLYCNKTPKFNEIFAKEKEAMAANATDATNPANPANPVNSPNSSDPSNAAAAPTHSH